ncbi:MAG: hydroxymethylglutaryl-CoA reductase, degradative [Candidatus Heimdallarchaeota archaeon]|nr:hydroxymethylglutaryl-CoA reductase, degradative [Candidatus Heimdallarchaeota archaeon]MCG3255918.1 hydroxymethylglutaryl-CoA reductase, degradative [Candidatus Heimdallarchaeota archaeon]MCK4610989.1 hydroxymethylglutaryl-CoA reductase, degradative [Candidatus Heimdallarchaeota archaeon]
MPFNSRIPNFYNLSLEEKRNKVADLCNLTNEEIALLKGQGIKDETLSYMIENMIGRVVLPLGIATNFTVNERDHLVPMAVEESSIVAAASHAAKIARKKGGFVVEYTGSIAIGQIQIIGLDDFKAASSNILKNKDILLELANRTNKILMDLGGGAKDIEIREVDGKLEKYLVVHLIVDVKDAMGANAVNTMLEKIKFEIEKITSGEVLLKIISNYAIRRLVKVKAVFDKEELGGEDVVDKILLAYDFAEHDIYRCTTHNKGIMNGITAVLLATGNDSRAVEAGAHAFAVKEGRYRSLSRFEKNKDGDLVGYLEVPTFVGILGGAMNVNPIYKLSFKIMGISSAKEFSEVLGAVGLAQNLAALRALCSEGIQKGHMSLHARNIAITAGAKGENIERIAQQMMKEEKISFDRAKELL